MNEDRVTSNPQNNRIIDDSENQPIQNTEANRLTDIVQSNDESVRDTINQGSGDSTNQISPDEDSEEQDDTTIESSDMSEKSTPESGSYLVCNGATCKCEFGDTLVKIKILSQNKVFINDASASQKLVATIKDSVFPPPFFGRCTQNPASGKPCVYSPTNWEILGNTQDHPEIASQPILTENSQIKCGAFQGNITIVTHGQEIAVDSGSEDQIDEAEILAINCFFEPIEADDDIKKARVDNIEYNNQKSGNTELVKVRMNREALFRAKYGLDKRNISWQLWQKTADLDKDDETSFIYKQHGEELKLFFPKEGTFSLEAFGAFFSERSQIWSNCVLKFEVVDKNEITHVKSGSGDLYKPSSTITVIRKKTYQFTIDSLFPLEVEELETLSAQMKDGRGGLLSDQYFKQEKELLTFTPKNIGLYTLFIDFGSENTISSFTINAISNEVVDVQTEPANIHNIRPNENITFVLKLKEDITSDRNNIKWFVKEPLKLTTKPFKDGMSITRKFSRPGKAEVGAVLDEDPLRALGRRFRSTIKMPANTYNLTVKNNTIANVTFDGVSENILGYPANKIALHIETQMPYDFTLDGGFVISIEDVTPDDFEQTKIPNIKDDDIIQVEDGKSETTTLNGEKGFWKTITFRDPTNWSKKFFHNKLNFIFNKTGKYKISIALSKNPSELISKEITIDESEIIKWCFSDEAGNRYTEIGWYQLVYLQVEAKGWANKSGYIGLYWDKNWAIDPLIDSFELSEQCIFDNKGKTTVSLGTSTWQKISELVNTKTPGTETLYFEIGGVDTVCKNWKKDKTRKLSDGKDIEQYKLDENKSTGNFLKNEVTIVDKTKIKAYFADEQGLLLKRIIKYGDPLNIIVQILRSKKDAETNDDSLSRYQMNIIENTKATSKNKEDRKPDSYIFNQARTAFNLINIDTLDDERKYYYPLNTNFGLVSPEYHKGIPDHQPRCFYLVIYDSTQKEDNKIKAIYQYPEEYNIGENNDKYLVDNLLDVNDENSTNEDYENWLAEKPDKTKEDWNNYVLSIQHKRTNYFLQLKIAKDDKMNFSYPETRPVLIGEGTTVQKEHMPGDCPRCNAAIRGTVEEWRKAGENPNEVILKTIFPKANDDRLNAFANAYTEYMHELGVASCSCKAVFVAVIAVEVGEELVIAKGENMGYTTRKLMLDKFANRFFNGERDNNRTWHSDVDYNATYHEQADGRVYKGKREQDFVNEVLTTPLANDERAIKLSNFVYDDANSDTKLGNIYPGDGWRFRGSGFIQLTGRGNFKLVEDVINGIYKNSILTDEGANKVRDDVDLATLTSMAYLKIYEMIDPINKLKDLEETERVREINRLLGMVGNNTGHTGSDNHTLKKEFLKNKTAPLFKMYECKKGEESQPLNGEFNQYRIDIDLFKIEKILKNESSQTYQYVLYKNNTQLTVYTLTKNSYGWLPFPETGDNWGRYGTRDRGGDNWIEEKVCAALFGYFYSLSLNGFSDSLYYNDINAHDGRNIGHSGHRRGDDIDIRYPGSRNTAGEVKWKEAKQNAKYGNDETKFIQDLELVLEIADKWGFNKNYAYKRGIKYTENVSQNTYNIHDNHFHLGYR